MKILIGLGLIAVGCWQFYAAIQYSKFLRHHAGKGTSPFALVATYFGYVAAIAFVVVGISVMFNKF